MTNFVFREELEEATIAGAQVLFGMVQASLERGELPPKDILEWFTKITVYQFAQAEHEMLNAADSDTAEKIKYGVLALAEEVRKLAALGNDQKMFWLAALINDTLKVRLLRLPERYQQLLREDMLP